MVPARFAGVDLVSLPALYDNPVYRIPVPLRLAYNKAAVAIGVARGALDAFVELANTKTPMLSSGLLRDRPVAHLRMGEGEANLRSARAFLFEAMGQVEHELHQGVMRLRRTPPRRPVLPARTPPTPRCTSSTPFTTPEGRAQCAWTARWSASCATRMVARPTVGSPIQSTRSWGESSSVTRPPRSTPALASRSPTAK